MGPCGLWRVRDMMEAHFCSCASKLARLQHGHRRSALGHDSQAWHCSMCQGKAGTAYLLCNTIRIDSACFHVIFWNVMEPNTAKRTANIGRSGEALHSGFMGLTSSWRRICSHPACLLGLERPALARSIRCA